jgi:hypothetical protein
MQRSKQCVPCSWLVLAPSLVNIQQSDCDCMALTCLLRGSKSSVSQDAEFVTEGQADRAIAGSGYLFLPLESQEFAHCGQHSIRNCQAVRCSRV